MPSMYSLPSRSLTYTPYPSSRMSGPSLSRRRGSVIPCRSDAISRAWGELSTADMGTISFGNLYATPGDCGVQADGPMGQTGHRAGQRSLKRGLTTRQPASIEEEHLLGRAPRRWTPREAAGRPFRAFGPGGRDARAPRGARSRSGSYRPANGSFGHDPRCITRSRCPILPSTTMVPSASRITRHASCDVLSFTS